MQAKCRGQEVVLGRAKGTLSESASKLSSSAQKKLKELVGEVVQNTPVQQKTARKALL